MLRFFKVFLLVSLLPAYSAENDRERILAAMLANNSMIDNLASLTDEIGGRPTGSAANLAAVEWALARFRERGVSARKEPFSMPNLWQEQNVSATVEGDLQFPVKAVAMPFSAATHPDGQRAPLLDVGFGSEADFAALAGKARGAFLLVRTHELLNLDDLFREYAEVPHIDARANKAKAAGVVYMSSRPRNLLYRHNAGLADRNTLPMVIMERESASRIQRLLASGKNLHLNLKIAISSGDTYTSYNVIGEIKGSAQPEEFVVIGAHLDSWDLGTGALDNGCNVAMLIEIAAQFHRLGIRPKRTIRFCLWNGEEQGMYGSAGYTKTHAGSLDAHVMALSMDIGSGKLVGFFADGPKPFLLAIDQALLPVAAFGPFSHIVTPIVGTDNYDFLIQGVANLVGNQASANYGPNYHAQSDTFDKVDQKQLRLNSVVVATLAYQFAQMHVSWKRRTHAQIADLIKNSDLEQQMRSWNTWDGWLDGSRGRKLPKGN